MDALHFGLGAVTYPPQRGGLEGTSMTSILPAASDDLRVVICLEFDRRASPLKVAKFRTALLNCPCVTSGSDLTGTFDFMVEAALPDIGSFNEWLEGIKGALANLVSRYETNFVTKRFVRAERDVGHAVWVRCEDGMKRVDSSLINKVTAEGDYMRLHTDGESWMFHSTMNDISERLGADFILVHRSTLLRSSFINHLRHEGRAWTAVLDDGSVERIAQTRIVALQAKLRSSSSDSEPASTNGEDSAESPAVPKRKVAAAFAHS